MVGSCKETQLQSKRAARCHLPLSASAAERLATAFRGIVGIAAPLPGFRPVVKIAGGFAADYQAVHKLVGKIIDSNPPKVSIDLGGLGSRRSAQNERTVSHRARVGRKKSRKQLFAALSDTKCPGRDLT